MNGPFLMLAPDHTPTKSASGHWHASGENTLSRCSTCNSDPKPFLLSESGGGMLLYPSYGLKIKSRFRTLGAALKNELSFCSF